MRRRGETRFGINGDLPAGCRHVKCLKTSRTQYIDTGVRPTQNTGFYIDFFSDMPITTNESQSGCFFGTRYNSYGNNQYCYWMSSFGSAQCCIGLTTKRMSSNYVPNKRQQASYTPYTLTDCIGGIQTNQNTSSFTCVKNLLLFCTRTGNTDATPSEFGKLDLFSFKLTGNFNLDFIPIVARVDGKDVGYLFDKVSRTYLPYGNAGTGNLGWEELDGTIVSPT